MTLTEDVRAHVDHSVSVDDPAGQDNLDSIQETEFFRLWCVRHEQSDGVSSRREHHQEGDGKPGTDICNINNNNNQPIYSTV